MLKTLQERSSKKKLRSVQITSEAMQQQEKTTDLCILQRLELNRNTGRALRELATRVCEEKANVC